MENQNVKFVCSECNASEGQYHIIGCTEEQCPKCGNFLFGCECEFKNDPEKPQYPILEDSNGNEIFQRIVVTRKNLEENNMRKPSNECYQCKFRRSVPGDRHSCCINPDLNMIGNLHGMRNGWFYYPLNFDPIWKEKLCDNFISNKSLETGQAI